MQQTTPPIRIGTRGSPLAIAQTEEVKRRLCDAHPHLAADPGQVQVEVIKTTGDNVQDRALAEIGGKALFTKEIDEALLDGRIDMAVHSMKDVPTYLPDGMVMPAILEREDPRDVFICLTANSFAELPEGALVGTSSLRRQAQVLARRPDLQVTLFRGNVQTRLRKLKEGVADATMLALAGLNRMDMADVATAVLAPEEMLPAVGQGAVGVASRAGDEAAETLLAPLHHRLTHDRVMAERAFLRMLDGSCRTPIAALALPEGENGLWLRGLLASEDGTRLYETQRHAPRGDAEAMGEDAGREVRAAARTADLPGQ